MSTFLHDMTGEQDMSTDWDNLTPPDDDEDQRYAPTVNGPSDADHLWQIIDAAGGIPQPEKLTVALPPDADLKRRADSLHLYDARFLGTESRDAKGSVEGYGVACIELYADPKTSQLSGKVLPVGNYSDVKEAEAQYVTLQSQVGKDVPVHAVAAFGEQTAVQNGALPEWHRASQDDIALYLQHRQLERQEIAAPSQSIPAKPVVFTVAEASAISNGTLDENQQARSAIREIGLEPPKDFDLNRDSLLDQRTGIRCVSGIFQQDLADKTANCQATLIALGSEADRMQAEAVAVGHGGSFAQARDHWEQVNTALYGEGPFSALQTIEQIDQKIQREMPVPADLSGPSAQEVQALSNTLDLI